MHLKMRFDCPCSQHSSQAVSQLLDVLVSERKFDQDLLSGMVRLLNTMVRNLDSHVLSHPQELRIYSTECELPTE